MEYTGIVQYYPAPHNVHRLNRLPMDGPRHQLLKTLAAKTPLHDGGKWDDRQQSHSPDTIRTPTRTSPRSSPPGCPASHSRTSAPSTGRRGAGLTCSPPGSRVRTFSAAGRRAGIENGARSGLWTDIVAGVRVLRPRSSWWRTSRASLAPRRSAPWYSATWPKQGMTRRGVAFRAADIGAAHRRERVFLLYLDNLRPGQWIFHSVECCLFGRVGLTRASHVVIGEGSTARR